VNDVDVREAITRAHHEEWARVSAALYDQLIRLDTSPIITLNRAIATAYLTRRHDQLR
jgi:predicted RNA polymerase sigma factor